VQDDTAIAIKQVADIDKKLVFIIKHFCKGRKLRKGAAYRILCETYNIRNVNIAPWHNFLVR
jgi:hypothetical protein